MTRARSNPKPEPLSWAMRPAGVHGRMRRMPTVAAAFLLSLLALDPGADLARGRALVEAGDLGAAADQYRQLTAAFPTWGLAHIELAEVLVAAGAQDPGLARVLAAARSLEPLNPRAWALSGRFSDRQGDAASGLQYWGRVAELRPEQTEARERLGALLVVAGRHAEAVPHLKVVIAASPDDRTSRALLAEALEAVGDVAEAEVELRALVASSPRNVSYRRRLVDFLDRTLQPEKAAAEARKADALRPGRKLRELPRSADRR